MNYPTYYRFAGTGSNPNDEQVDVGKEKSTKKWTTRINSQIVESFRLYAQVIELALSSVQLLADSSTSSYHKSLFRAGLISITTEEPFSLAEHLGISEDIALMRKHFEDQNIDYDALVAEAALNVPKELDVQKQPLFTLEQFDSLFQIDEDKKEQ